MRLSSSSILVKDVSRTQGAVEKRAPDPGAGEAHEAVRANKDIQFELPEYEPEVPEFPTWLKPLFEALGEFLAFIGPAIPYVLGAVLVGLLCYFLWPILSDWFDGRRYGGVRTLPDWRPEQRTARILLAEADMLASEGRYAEAAHLLLHRSIEDIQAARPDLVRVGFTSREIADHREMPEDARGVFAPIAQLVERGLFAGRSIAEPDWLGVRSAYDQFVFARAS
ncbi:DUF4129 domain-containing protein [Pacificimonas sp. WHA3]|uniref:DUF4129 domain-containing protein n=1 Tax=Pacificimonas pallii TaxID=2827236 RepID=A0ABS6SF08_9SPHN|nr:DUF4129 domain-containing protein [Pacificimonas pallii]MBV7256442.1 DUF4129 domain-containing protein [Pacificimonas pallii]